MKIYCVISIDRYDGAFARNFNGMKVFDTEEKASRYAEENDKGYAMDSEIITIDTSETNPFDGSFVSNYFLKESR